MQRLLFAGAALLAIAGCASSSAMEGGAGALAFSDARLVSRETENGATPMFLATPAGDRVLSWVSAPGGGSDGAVHFSVTPAGADQPLPTVTVRDSIGPIEAHGEAPPQLGADAEGRLYLLYAVGKEVPGQRFPISALRVVRSDDHGRTWSAPVTINDQGKYGEFGAHNFHALTVGPDGSIVATWLDGRTGTSGVWMSRSSDHGSTWTPNTAVYSDSTCPCCRTGVALDTKGNMFISWRAVLPGDVRDIVVMRSADAGKTWETPVRPQADDWVFSGCPHAGPSMKLDAAGNIHVAWWTGKPGAAGVYYAKSTDGGKTFAAQPLATGERSTPAHVQLALTPKGGVVVIWDDGLSKLPRVLVRRSTDGGATFAGQQVVSQDGMAAGYPVLAVAGDSIAIAWSQMTEAAHHDAMAAKMNMKDPKAAMGLPRVGQSEIYLRTAKL